MDLFNATLSPKTVCSAPPQRCTLSTIPRDRRRLEVFLENHRPEKAQKRLACTFACDNTAGPSLYLDAEIRRMPAPYTGPRYLYRVTAGALSKHPMALVNIIDRCLSDNDLGRAVKLAQEYWSPSETWRFHEYICHDVLIVEDLSGSRPDSMQVYLSWEAYKADIAKGKALFSI